MATQGVSTTVTRTPSGNTGLPGLTWTGGGWAAACGITGGAGLGVAAWRGLGCGRGVRFTGVVTDIATACTVVAGGVTTTGGGDGEARCVGGGGGGGVVAAGVGVRVGGGVVGGGV